MSKTLAILLFALVCAQASDVHTAHEVRGRTAKPLFFKKLLKAGKSLLQKAVPKIIDKVVPGPVGNLIKGAIPVLTGGGSLGSKLGQIGQQVLGSGLLPPKVQNIANTAMNAVKGFQNGGIQGAINGATGGKGLSSILPGPLGNIAQSVLGGGGSGGGGLGGLLGGGGSGGGLGGLLGGGGSGGGGLGGLLGGGGSGGGSGGGLGGLLPGAGAAGAAGNAGSAAGNHAAVLGNNGLGGGLTQGSTATGQTGAAPPTAAPVSPPVPPPAAAKPAKPLPQVKGKSSGQGQPSSPGNPAKWTGHAVDPMAAASGTSVKGIQGGSGDATTGFTMKGRFGNLKVQSDGTWEYDLDESNALVKAYGSRPNALFDVFTLLFNGTPPGKPEIRIHVWEHFKKSP